MCLYLGPRTCPGEPLARMELFLVFSNLMQRFNFYRENENAKHSLEATVGRTTNPPTPWKLRAVYRS